MAKHNTFQNAHNFVMNHPNFINNPLTVQVSQPEKRGLQILLGASIRAATYDSSEHPRHCHPGTRIRHIDQIVNWALETPDHSCRIFWLKGPAGVGKSAIAQSCAEEFAAQKKLAAAFFFSRPNQREDPQRLFTSISYQWTLKHKSYADILQSTIHDDPTIIDKELSHQFYHLFSSPLQELDTEGEGAPKRVVIIDGLDECAGVTAQQTIVEIIAASIRDHTIPFIWLICSRLEPHLNATFNSPEVSAVTHQEELTVSRAIDNEIAKYLTDELAKIGREYDPQLPWPCERDIGTLINLSSGLFIYANTVVRFIGDSDSLGPEDQLEVICTLATGVTQGSSEHPLSELDSFYLLIVQRIPAKILQTVKWILLATRFLGNYVRPIRQLLGLSPSQFHAACRTLHSVMKFDWDDIVFYHASFMDFMQDPQRSRHFCISSESGLALRTKLMQRLQALLAESFHDLIQADSDNNSEDDASAYENIVIGFLFLSSTLPWDAAAIATLESFNFKKMAELWAPNIWAPFEIGTLFSHIPEEDRSRIVQLCEGSHVDTFMRKVVQTPDRASWSASSILGCGQHRCFCWYCPSDGLLMLRPYIDCSTVEHPTTGQPMPDEAPHTLLELQSTVTFRRPFW
ncbi:hypothetical protein P691DRAFT_776292 [Macrolepiota fuliginosa MF-IS2]|uniref:Nephrocystin 3-like N-terminal domain-containing protein n=1 Tax=Macrolepiota fuliginosa MF-IS2 TaxID=1400762 RepID=A0A9P5XA16_9AGAR|nr:hypothetical protein P691DRAFT_776292 [Macrolepiota fuliginosa MF-IS2]